VYNNFGRERFGTINIAMQFKTRDIRSEKRRDVACTESRDYYDCLATTMDLFSWYSDGDIEDLVISMLTDNAQSVIEICCGSGRLLSRLAEVRRWSQIVGVDISDSMVHLAKMRNFKNGVSIFQSDWVSSIQEGKHFDVVIVKNALHLQNDLYRRLSEIKAIIPSFGSLIIIETISPNNVTREFIKRLFASFVPSSPKWHYFTKRSLLQNLRKAGWVINTKTDLYLHRQMLDVQKWLDAKCHTAKSRRAAETLLANAPADVRMSLAFSPSELGEVPRKMLRLQMVCRVIQNLKPQAQEDPACTCNSQQTILL